MTIVGFVPYPGSEYLLMETSVEGKIMPAADERRKTVASALPGTPADISARTGIPRKAVYAALYYMQNHGTAHRVCKGAFTEWRAGHGDDSFRVVSHSSAARRKKIAELCGAAPRTRKELVDALGAPSSTVQYDLQEMMNLGDVVRVGNRSHAAVYAAASGTVPPAFKTAGGVWAQWVGINNAKSSKSGTRYTPDRRHPTPTQV